MPAPLLDIPRKPRVTKSETVAVHWFNSKSRSACLLQNYLALALALSPAAKKRKLVKLNLGVGNPSTALGAQVKTWNSPDASTRKPLGTHQAALPEGRFF